MRVRGAQVSWDGIGFGLAERFEALRGAESFRLAYRPEWNEFRGARTIQLNIKSLQAVS